MALGMWSDRKVLVLIHGGSHGAWCWAETQTLLSAKGVASHAFDLPGCGADSTARNTVDLQAQVDCVLQEIRSLAIDEVTLVGHSIGGWLLPPVAQALAQRGVRVAELVFVGAAVLNRGQTGLSVTPKQRQPWYFDAASQSPDNSLMLDFAAAWARFFQDLPEQQARDVYAQLTPQPFQPYLDPAVVGIEDVDTPRRYLAMTRDLTYPKATTDAFAAKANCTPIVVDGDHCVMVTNPANLAAALTPQPPRSQPSRSQPSRSSRS